VRTFSQANPRGKKHSGDVPALLRRVAESLDALGKIEVLDLVLHSELDLDSVEYLPTITVYYSKR